MSRALPRASLIAVALLVHLGCSEGQKEPDLCTGDDAPALGCACLSGGQCPKTTGLRLKLQIGGLAAPADFDALAIQVGSDAFPPFRHNLDVFAKEPGRHTEPGKSRPLQFPLDLLLLAELPVAPTGTDGSMQAVEVELDLMATAYLCRSNATQTAPLSSRKLEDCVSTIQRMTGSSGRTPRTVKLRAEKIKAVALKLEPVAGF